MSVTVCIISRLQGFLHKRIALWTSAFCLLLFAIFLNCGLLLHAAADFWIINHTATQADAIVVLGGGLQTRPFAAAELYHQGKAPTLLLFNVKPSPTTSLGLTPTEQELTRKVLLAHRVPDPHLVEIGNRVASSYDEALAVRAWLAQTGSKRILIPTDPFHTRRVQWLYARMLKGMGVDTLVLSVPQREYTASDWWHHEEGLIAFQNEVVKYIFYRLKY